MDQAQMEAMQRAQMEAMQAQMDAAQSGGIVMLIVQLAILVLLVASGWKLFTKAGQPGWAAIVPIYSAIVLLKIVGRPAWWIVLFLIPIVSLVAAILVSIDLARSFGKGTGFGIGILLLGFIFVPMLAFGSAQYKGPAAGGAAAPAMA